MKAPKRFIKLIENDELEEVKKWIENHGGDDCFIETIYISKKPQGERQSDYEYCYQETHSSESGVYAYSGVYYHKFEDSEDYLAYEFYIDA